MKPDLTQSQPTYD